MEAPSAGEREGPAPRRKEPQTGPFVWLASYPKSGNTWFRALLTSYLRGGEAPVISQLVGQTGAWARQRFNEMLGLDSSELSAWELLRLRPTYHRLLARRLVAPAFDKIHEAFLPIPPQPPAGGQGKREWLFAPEVSTAAICLVRNPLDVVVSYAHQRVASIAKATAWMNDPTATEYLMTKGASAALPAPMGTWSDHVLSWLDQQVLPMHVVRYEDMVADAAASFGAAIDFLEAQCGPLIEPSRRRAAIAAAVENAAFPRLREQEVAAGFALKPFDAESFFRAGVAGGWRETLNAEQVAKIVAAHGPVMARLGYLAEAEEFLRARRQDAAAQPQ